MNNKLLILIGAIVIYYILVDFIVTDLMLYLAGGIIGGSITEIFNLVGITPSIRIVWIIWLTLLLMLIWILPKTENTYFRYFLIILIAHFLYLIDLILVGEVLPENRVLSITYINLAIRIICKSAILILIILRPNLSRNPT